MGTRVSWRRARRGEDDRSLDEFGGYVEYMVVIDVKSVRK